jgi:hypothetical protein
MVVFAGMGTVTTVGFARQGTGSAGTARGTFGVGLPPIWFAGSAVNTALALFTAVLTTHCWETTFETWRVSDAVARIVQFRPMVPMSPEAQLAGAVPTSVAPASKTVTCRSEGRDPFPPLFVIVIVHVPRWVAGS